MTQSKKICICVIKVIFVYLLYSPWFSWKNQCLLVPCRWYGPPFLTWAGMSVKESSANWVRSTLVEQIHLIDHQWEDNCTFTASIHQVISKPSRGHILFTAFLCMFNWILIFAHSFIAYLSELEAYAGVISALRAQGDLTKDKKDLLGDLTKILG